MKWFRRKPAEPAAPSTLSVAAQALMAELVDHHHDGDEPTGIGWFLPDEEPPWAVLDELVRSGYCEIDRDGDMVELDLTAIGRQKLV